MMIMKITALVARLHVSGPAPVMLGFTVGKSSWIPCHVVIPVEARDTPESRKLASCSDEMVNSLQAAFLSERIAL